MEKSKFQIDQKVLDRVVNTIQSLEYGEVLITVHSSKIVEIEKKERKRV